MAIQKPCARGVAHSLARMLISIKLNSQSDTRAIEVENVWTYRMLSAEGRAKLRTTE